MAGFGLRLMDKGAGFTGELLGVGLWVGPRSLRTE